MGGIRCLSRWWWDSAYRLFRHRFDSDETPTRWGVFGCLTTATLFLFSLAIAVVALVYPRNGSGVMSGWERFLIALASLCFIAAVGVVFLTVAVVISYKRRTLRDTTPDKLREIAQGIADIKRELLDMKTKGAADDNKPDGKL